MRTPTILEPLSPDEIMQLVELSHPVTEVYNLAEHKSALLMTRKTAAGIELLTPVILSAPWEAVMMLAGQIIGQTFYPQLMQQQPMGPAGGRKQTLSAALEKHARKPS